MEKPLSIVIPTWNRLALLEECLASLAVQTWTEFEVVVVDDGSTDGTAEALWESHPCVRVVRLEANSGFCKAANAGIRAALERESCALIFLLNNDMTLEPDCLQHLMDAAQQSEAALFAPLVVFRDEPEVIYGAGDRQRANGRPESIGFRQPLADFAHPQAIFGVSGGAGLYRREVFERVGLLDERFVAYFEDSDLNWRARWMGFHAEYVQGAVARHVGSATIEGKTWWRSQQCCRNHALLVARNMSWGLLRRHAGAVLAERLNQERRLVSSARTGFGLAGALGRLLGTWWAILTALPHAFRERRRIMRERTVTDDAMDALLTGDRS